VRDALQFEPFRRTMPQAAIKASEMPGGDAVPLAYGARAPQARQNPLNRG